MECKLVVEQFVSSQSTKSGIKAESFDIKAQIHVLI